MPFRPTFALLAVLAACDTTYDNVDACEQFLVDEACGSFDLRTLLDCEAFATEVTCDLQPYFDCLAENGTCDLTTDPATYDDAGWATCADLAICPRDSGEDTDAGDDTDGGDTEADGDTDAA